MRENNEKTSRNIGLVSLISAVHIIVEPAIKKLKARSRSLVKNRGGRKLKRIITCSSLIIIIVGVCLSGSVSADWRPYAYSYGYMTPYQGEKEIEVYTDYQNKNAATSLKNQIELEYGITNAWMVALYGVFSGSNTQGYKYSQTKIETRYRFGQPGDFIMDPALYLEYKAPVSGNSAVEFKEILSKDLADWNVTTNLVFEKELVEGSEIEQGYTLGISKKFARALRAGLEAKGSIDGANSTLYLGPSIAAVWNAIKVNAVLGIGLTEASNSVSFRNILSVEL